MRAPELLVFYDSWCPLCTRAMQVIKQHDYNGKINFMTFRDPLTMNRYHLWDKQVDKKIYAIRYEDKQSYSGIDTVHQMIKRIPRYRAFSPLVWCAIKIGVGERIYQAIANRRKIIPVGQCEGDSCSLRQDKKP
ncbi:thioredoxin [Pullulanibacillus camelliae]|uniref:Thioredoxin n=1 Tax=Pullulanibacillus camelliae TaxID=1707096 RepID=A0A8J2YNH4_9BACL|nr:DUF393 domain-containing protein [Pullulanibacillus camelliae]GGE56512.1 thioredoxin [Pullulanibacillus camelliae]